MQLITRNFAHRYQSFTKPSLVAQKTGQIAGTASHGGGGAAGSDCLQVNYGCAMADVSTFDNARLFIGFHVEPQ